MNEMTVVKMLGTTNRRFEDMCGMKGYGRFIGKIFMFENLQTSFVTECRINENIMTVKTRNSEYTFELLNGAKFQEFKRTSEEILEMERNCR